MGPLKVSEKRYRQRKARAADASLPRGLDLWDRLAYLQRRAGGMARPDEERALSAWEGHAAKMAELWNLERQIAAEARRERAMFLWEMTGRWLALAAVALLFGVVVREVLAMTGPELARVAQALLTGGPPLGLGSALGAGAVILRERRARRAGGGSTRAVRTNEQDPKGSLSRNL